MARTSALFLLVVAAILPAAVDAAGASMAMQNRANPIRKVVNMLQNLQKQVTTEGKKEEELFEQFMCYCKTGVGNLQATVSAAEDKIPQLEAMLKGSDGQKKQLDEDLKAGKAARAESEEAVAKATAIRKKEADAFAVENGDLTTNIKSLDAAVTAISKGVGSAFLQTNAAAVVRSYVMDQADMIDTSRQEVLAFLSGTDANGYAPQSGEINGILKQMRDEMAGNKADIIATEESSIKDFEAMMAAKKKEVGALTMQIEEKTQRVGELAVAVASTSNELEDTKEAFAEDSKFLADLGKNCATKAAENEENQKMRSQELVALGETIKVLNDDDALDLFKKTLPSASASFMQIQVSASTVRAQALSALRSQRARRPQLDFIALALHNKKIGFEKIIGMIDEMVATLKTEQADDDKKKEYCAAEFDSADDEKKSLQRSISDAETAIEEAQGSIEALAEEIKTTIDGIKALDKSVAEATAQRKEENDEYKELMANDGSAKELLNFAKNRLNKFYNPKLYVAPKKRELSEADQITVNSGGELAATPAPGGIAGTGIGFVQVSMRSRSDGAPAPPPETAAAYTKSSEESGGCIAMIDLLIKDIDKEMTLADATEKDAQADYEKAMKDSAEKRAQDSKDVSDKEGAKAELEEQLQGHKNTRKENMASLGETLNYIKSLHNECDWLMQYYDTRKTARSEEIDALGKGKDVLNGADYSFLQTASSRRFLQAH